MGRNSDISEDFNFIRLQLTTKISETNAIILSVRLGIFDSASDTKTYLYLFFLFFLPLYLCLLPFYFNFRLSSPVVNIIGIYLSFNLLVSSYSSLCGRSARHKTSAYTVRYMKTRNTFGIQICDPSVRAMPDCALMKTSARTKSVSLLTLLVLGAHTEQTSWGS